MIVLDWQYVLPDNHRLMPVVRTVRGKPKAVMVMSAEYRLAKRSVELIAKSQWKRAPFAGPVKLHARAFFPDLRKRDARNYAKLITDALTGIAYRDDSQLHSETWDRAGIDRARPRIEITLTEIPA